MFRSTVALVRGDHGRFYARRDYPLELLGARTRAFLRLAIGNGLAFKPHSVEPRAWPGRIRPDFALAQSSGDMARRPSAGAWPGSGDDRLSRDVLSQL